MSECKDPPRRHRRNEAVCKWIPGQVGKWEDEAKAELGDMMAGDRQAALLAGYKIGTVTMCGRKREFRAIDDNRLAEWVRGRCRNRSSRSCRYGQRFYGSWPTAR
jgi:hypothetical protein